MIDKNNDVEDIFEEVDGSSEAQQPSASFKPPVQPQSQPETQPQPRKIIMEDDKAPVSKSKLIVRIVLIVAAILLIGVVAYTVWSSYFMDDQSDNGQVLINDNQNENLSNTNLSFLENFNINASNTNTVSNTNTQVILDTDRDGLTDDEEKELGTSINSTDTDNDGLFDYEEVKVYGTDPTDPDTDNDTFLDGAEVKSGYNPKGEGELYNLNQALKNLNNGQ